MSPSVACAARACAACLLLSLFPRPAHATVDGVVGGVVHDRHGAPLPGAAVLLHDARGGAVATAKSDGAGVFLIEGVPFGDYTIEARGPDDSEDHQPVQVSSAAGAVVDLYCLPPGPAQAPGSTVHGAAGVAPPTRAAASLSSLSRAALDALPGGDNRALPDALGTQPGFVADALGNVYARGNHANIQYQIDGIPLPDSVGSLFANALPLRFVERLELFTGGMPAEFGQRLAAVVNLRTRQGGEARDGQVQLRYGSFQAVEPSATYGQSFGGTSLFLGASYLHTQRGLDPPAVIPVLHDEGQGARAFLRLDQRLGEHDQLELLALYAWNRFQIPIDPTVAPLDPGRPDRVRAPDAYGNASPPFVPHDTDATETEHEAFAALSLRHRFAGRGQLQLSPYYKLSLGTLASDPLHALGTLADPGSTVSDVTRRAQHGGGVAHYTVQLGGHAVKAGLQVDYLDGQTAYAQYVRNDTAPAGGPDPQQGGAGTDQTRALSGGLYLQDRWERGRVSLHAGVRADLVSLWLGGGQRDLQVGVSPRLGLALQLHDEVVAHLFVGLNWQPPAPLDTPSAARALGVVAAGQAVAYDIRPETDLYGELGVEARGWQRLRLGVVGWGRYAWDQLDDTAVGNTSLLASYNFARGRAVGVEARAELSWRWLAAFANAGWEIAQGQGISSARYLFSPEQLADSGWQTLDHAQTWTVNAGATARHQHALLSLLCNYGSGLRTGPGNSATVPEHVRLDLTLSYAFEQLPLAPRVSLDVINLLDAHYAFRIANGFVGSAWAAPRSVFVRLVVPLSAPAKGGVR